MTTRRTDSIRFLDRGLAIAGGVESGSISADGTIMNWVRGLSTRNMSASFVPAFESRLAYAPICASDGKREKSGDLFWGSRLSP